jgi:predicted MFS family arabinose efflux permease
MTQNIRWMTALGLSVCISMAAAVSLGMTRFAYALLLPPMRDDLLWSYTLAGAMNTFNAVGYLVGALLTPWALRRCGAVRVLIWGALAATTFMGMTGFLTDTSALLFQRFLAGVASAAVFVSGGLLAARLGAQIPAQSGLLLGVYYGGTGWGIVLSALMVPASLTWAQAQAVDHPWSWAWWSLAGLCLALSLLMILIRRPLTHWAPESPPSIASSNQAAPATRALRQWFFALLGYGCFGVGYIGYMTFVVALLREQGAGPADITLFYALLGVAVVVSSRVWSGLLNHYRGGQALSILNALLSVATLIPAITAAWPLMMISGLIFGLVFLSLVASTTAMVKHNLPPQQWASGISVFTVIFALGQIVGPVVVGWIADGEGGLQRGLLFSAMALLLGSYFAWQQKPLTEKQSLDIA